MSATITALPPVEGVREGNENLVRLTAPAGAKVAALIAREGQGDFLRVAITGGGCNGLSYKLRFAAEAKRGDILVRSAGIPVLVDAKTALYLKGTELDFSDKMIGGGSSSRIPTPRPPARAARASASELI